MRLHLGSRGLLSIGLYLLGALAQAAAGEITRAQFVRDATAHYFVPRVAAFAKVAPTLTETLETLCRSPGTESLAAARAAWIKTMLAWENASAIGFGPLLARRAVYHIDYWPPRENLILQALSKPPTSIKELELIGGPAKGLPAIEWLLWTPAAKPDLLVDAGRCAYARLLAQDVAGGSARTRFGLCRFSGERPFGQRCHRSVCRLAEPGAWRSRADGRSQTRQARQGR